MISFQSFPRNRAVRKRSHLTEDRAEHLLRPVALRPRLSTGLPLSIAMELISGANAPVQWLIRITRRDNPIRRVCASTIPPCGSPAFSQGRPVGFASQPFGWFAFSMTDYAVDSSLFRVKVGGCAVGNTWKLPVWVRVWVVLTQGPSPTCGRGVPGDITHRYSDNAEQLLEKMGATGYLLPVTV
jgi:hypothetical protein